MVSQTEAGQETSGAEVADGAVVETPDEGKATETQEQATTQVSPEMQELKDQLAVMGRELQAARSAAGSARKQAELEAMILRSHSLLEVMLEHQTSDDPDPAALRTKAQEIRKQETEAVMANRTAQVKAGYESAIGGWLEEIGLKPEDPKLAEVATLWVTSEQTDDLNGYFQAMTKAQGIYLAEKARQSEEAAQARVLEAEQRFKQDNNTLGQAIDGGTPGGGQSLEEYIKRVKAGDALPDPKEIDRLTSKYLR